MSDYKPDIEDEEVDEQPSEGGETTPEEEVDDLTIEDYLKGVTAYEIAENALRVVLVRRGVSRNALVSELLTLVDDKGVQIGQRTIDLATADIYMWCASTPSVKNDTEDSDGGWKHKEGGWETSAYDKRELRKMAKDLYDKWGESSNINSKMRIVNF